MILLRERMSAVLTSMSSAVFHILQLSHGKSEASAVINSHTLHCKECNLRDRVNNKTVSSADENRLCTSLQGLTWPICHLRDKGESNGIHHALSRHSTKMCRRRLRHTQPKLGLNNRNKKNHNHELNDGKRDKCACFAVYPCVATHKQGSSPSLTQNDSDISIHVSNSSD